MHWFPMNSNIGRGLMTALMVVVATAAKAQSDSTDRAWTIERISTLVQGLQPSALKKKLNGCLKQDLQPSKFSIGHRGAPLRYAEHTRESYLAAASQGAGAIECDVTFTKDKQLVCRHSQCDLHRTTNILRTPLANSCRTPFSPATDSSKASATCCTADITTAQFLTLKGRSDHVNRNARNIDDYLQEKNKSGGGRHVENATLMTHRQSIELFHKLGVAMVPELKAPQVDMPFGGDYTRQQYARQLIEDYRTENIQPTQVFPQSFHLQDILEWIKVFPEFGRQAILLDGRYRGPQRINPMAPNTFEPSMQALATLGIRTIAPPLWMLLTTDGSSIVPSAYATAASSAGLDIVTWTLERSGTLDKGGGWYYQTLRPQISKQSDMLRVLDTLHQQAGVRAMFSDWPATTTFYANCMGLR